MNQLKLDDTITFSFSPPLLIYYNVVGQKKVSPLVRTRTGWRSFYNDRAENQLLHQYKSKMEEAFAIYIERVIVSE